jgi:hypothetical protein
MKETTVIPTTREVEDERSMLRIAMTPDMGRGVFATRDIPANVKVAVYPGVVHPPQKTNADEVHSKYAWEMKMAVGAPGGQRIVDGYSVNAGDAQGNVLPQFEQYAAPFVNEPNTPGENNLSPVINFTRQEGQALEYWSVKPIKKGQQLFICYQRSEKQRNGTLIKRCPKGPSVRYVWGNNETPLSRPASTERYLTAGKKRERRAREVINLTNQKKLKVHANQLLAQRRQEEFLKVPKHQAESGPSEASPSGLSFSHWAQNPIISPKKNTNNTTTKETLKQYHAAFLKVDTSKKFDMCRALMALHKSGLVTDKLMLFVSLLSKPEYGAEAVAFHFSLVTDWLGTGSAGLGDLNRWVGLHLQFADEKHALGTW